jgi:hypothetical protein
LVKRPSEHGGRFARRRRPEYAVGAFVGGADIGANIVYRYQDGVLTGDKLWGADGFPCGAVVAGVNDVPGAICRDLHERLNLGPGRCPFP